MRLLIASILTILSFTAMSQQPLWWGMNPKGQLMIYQVDGQSGTTSTTHNLTGVPAGSVLVLTTAAESNEQDAVVTSSPSLTWTKQADADAGSSGDAEVYTAVFTAGGSIDVNSDWGASINQSSVCYVVVNQETTLGGNAASSQADAAPIATLTNSRIGSILFAVTSDWNAVDGEARTYRVGCFERYYIHTPGAYTAYHYVFYANTIFGHKLGLSSPSTMSAGTAAYEIRKKE